MAPTIPKLSDVSIHAWIQENHIVNEKGEPIEFGDHLFLFDIYADRSANIAVMKPAQVGMSTLQVIKNHYDAKRDKLDIIYTLPTDGDVNVFVSGKVNRIVANNSCMLADVVDKDSIEINKSTKLPGVTIGDARDDHSRIGMSDQDDIRQAFVFEHLQDVLDVGV